MVPAPFLVQIDTFRNQVPDTRTIHVGQYKDARSHTWMEPSATQPCLRFATCMLVTVGSN